MHLVKLTDDQRANLKDNQPDFTGKDDVIVEMENGLLLSGYLINGKKLELSSEIKSKKIKDIRLV